MKSAPSVWLWPTMGQAACGDLLIDSTKLDKACQRRHPYSSEHMTLWCSSAPSRWASRLWTAMCNTKHLSSRAHTGSLPFKLATGSHLVRCLAFGDASSMRWCVMWQSALQALQAPGLCRGQGSCSRSLQDHPAEDGWRGVQNRHRAQHAQVRLSQPGPPVTCSLAACRWSLFVYAWHCALCTPGSRPVG